MISSSTLGAFSVAARPTAPARSAVSPSARTQVAAIDAPVRGAERQSAGSVRPPMDPQARRGALLDISA